MKHHDGILYEDREGNVVEAIVAANAMDLSTPDGRFVVEAGDFLIVRDHYEIGMRRDVFLDRYREPGSWPAAVVLDEPALDVDAAAPASDDAEVEAPVEVEPVPEPVEPEPVEPETIAPDTTDAAAAPASDDAPPAAE